MSEFTASVAAVPVCCISISNTPTKSLKKAGVSLGMFGGKHDATPVEVHEG